MRMLNTMYILLRAVITEEKTPKDAIIRLCKELLKYKEITRKQYDDLFELINLKWGD